MGDFCYWEAKSLEDTIIIYINMLITLLLAGLAYRYFSLTTARLRRRVIIIYIGVGSWIVSTPHNNKPASSKISTASSSTIPLSPKANSGVTTRRYSPSWIPHRQSSSRPSSSPFPT